MTFFDDFYEQVTESRRSEYYLAKKTCYPCCSTCIKSLPPSPRVHVASAGNNRRAPRSIYIYIYIMHIQRLLIPPLFPPPVCSIHTRIPGTRYKVTRKHEEKRYHSYHAEALQTHSCHAEALQTHGLVLREPHAGLLHERHWGGRRAG